MSALFRVALATVLVAMSGSSFADEILRIHGSNTIGERLAPALAEAWLASRGYPRIERFAPAHDELLVRGSGPDGRFEVQIRAHGSSTGFVDLLAGAADLAMSSRPASAAEIERGKVLGALDSPQQEAVIALDGVAVIVHPDNPLRELRLPQLQAVFSGAVRDWSQLGRRGGAIRVHARDANSGTFETFRTLVLVDTALRSDALRYESTRELAQAVRSDPDAIGFVGLAGIGETRALAVTDAGEALTPTPFSVAVEDYALSRRLYLYRAENAAEHARAFVAFALSPAGQRVVDDTGFIAQQIRALRSAVRRDMPREYRDLVQDAERLSLNFRFGTGSSLLDSKAQVDLDRLAAFMREPGQRGRELSLLGFADASEIAPYYALTLSNDRVDFVAQQLGVRGIAVRRVRGMGGVAPVAGNDTAAGRHRNRRVEVWLGNATPNAGELANAKPNRTPGLSPPSP
jgi:phosphate transport system substrate-binding protein